MLGRIARLLGLAAGVVKLSRMFEKKEKGATGRQDPSREHEPDGIFHEDEKKRKRAKGRQDPSRENEPDGIFQLPASQARTLSPQGSRGGAHVESHGSCQLRLAAFRPVLPQQGPPTKRSLGEATGWLVGEAPCEAKEATIPSDPSYDSVRWDASGISSDHIVLDPW